MNESIKAGLPAFHWRWKGRSIPLGMGCAMLGQKWREPAPRKEALALLERCYDDGLRYFDTSGDYGDSELVLGAFLRTVGRESVFLATKAPFLFREHRETAFRDFRESFCRSFERLGTDRIDLFLIHDTEAYIPCAEEVIPFLEDRQREGLIGGFGLGTRSLIAHEHALLDGHVRACLSYFEYNLLDIAAKPLFHNAGARGAAVINGSTMMPGYLVRYDGSMAGISAERRSKMASPLGRRHDAIAALKRLCGDMGVDPLAAAVQFSLLEPQVDMTLVGISSISELEALEHNLERPLYPEQWAALRRLREGDPAFGLPEEYMGTRYLANQ